MSVNRTESLVVGAQNESRQYQDLKIYHKLKTWQHNDI